jgi:ceramide glucosyltransferase
MPGNTLWSRLEALAMSTSFMPGVLVAWALEGMKFALGPTMAIRRGCLKAIGGFAAMANYLADDFVLGHWAARKGYEVALSSYVLNHQVLGESFWSTFQHRLRWARSTRCSRPWGYVGEVFTHPLAPALGLLALAPQSPVCQAILAATVLMRWLVAWSVAGGILHDPNLRRSWWLVPAQDLLEFVVWCCGFLGRTVSWRGIRYAVGQDGCFVPVLEAASRSIAEHELAAAGSHFMDAAGRK